MINLSNYSTRVGLAVEQEDHSLAALGRLQSAHLTAIPFENLDVLADRGVRIDLASIEDKLVNGRRGGYCFEQNRLFANVLEQLGWEVRTLSARVRRGNRGLTALTHMTLEVTVERVPYLVDVGFGGYGALVPVPFTGSPVQGIPGVQHRLVQGPATPEADHRVWVLQVSHDEGDWQDLYAFEPIEAYPVDYEVYNYWTSTHPTSLFQNSMLVALHHPQGYRILFDGKLHIRDGGAERVVQFEDAAGIIEVLEDQFHLEVPEGCRFPIRR